MQFVERIKNEYPEIYAGGSSEGNKTQSYFSKWGWYATIAEIANNDILKMDAVLEKNVHYFHVFLAHKLDRAKMEARLRKNPKGNVTEL